MNQKFTIIIPTRERAETLYHTLKTCTSQNYDNLSIIISDNLSQDNTQEIVNSFNDSRIQYINTGSRLSMSHNWEFALSHVHNGFVTVLGDDDGLLPNAVKDTKRIIDETGTQAVNMNPFPDFYFWPSFFNKKQANTLKVSFDSGYEIVSAQKQLIQVLRCEADYLSLPMLYNSFVDVQLIHQVKGESTFFKSMIPDVYSGIAISSVIEKYVLSNKKLRLSGQSSKSTGASSLYANSNKDAVKQFFSESNIPYHKNVRYCNSINYGILECFLQAFDAGLCQHLRPEFDYLPFIRTGIKEANTKYKHDFEDIIMTTREVGKIAGLDAACVESLIKKGKKRWLNLIPYDVKRYAHLFLVVNASTYSANTIFEASLLHQTIYNHPARYIFSPYTWSFFLRLFFQELIARYQKSKK